MAKRLEKTSAGDSLAALDQFSAPFLNDLERFADLLGELRLYHHHSRL
jgi:hypothetical protein